MIKEPFIQPRFVVPRFEVHTLPLSAAKDLAAYEDLVLELAKHLFKKQQKDRIRIPKHFANNFSLHIEKIDDGSTWTPLVAVFAGISLFCNLPSEFNDAKALINRVIATEDGHPFPTDFPKEFYGYFNRIGRSLREGESIEWTPEQPDKTVLTQAKRIRLASAHRETYEAEVDVIGFVEVLDTKKKTGNLRIPGKDVVSFVYDDPFFTDIKEALGDPAVQAHVKGIGTFDVNERLCSIIEIDQFDCQPHFDLVSKIDALASLEDGWLEGYGIAPTNVNINWLTNSVVQYFPKDLDYPSVVPTEDGNVIFEWIRPQSRIELEINFANNQIEIYATDIANNEFIEKLYSKEQLDVAFGYVKGLFVL